MELNLMKNDKSTIWDEIIFSVFTLIILALGIVLVVCRPSFWIVNESMTVCFGVIMIMLAAMYIPCIVYRFMTNDKKEK